MGNMMTCDRPARGPAPETAASPASPASPAAEKAGPTHGRKMDFEEYAHHALVRELGGRVAQAEGLIADGQRDRFYAPAIALVCETGCTITNVLTAGASLRSTIPARGTAYLTAGLTLARAQGKITEGRQQLDKLIDDADHLAHIIEEGDGNPELVQEATALGDEAKRFADTQAKRLCRIC